MDLKSKGITWVGNIYQKFETICQEMDGIVSQDRVKYVENQVQTVGESVKKLYSDVVQDLLPPLVDPVKREGQAFARKRNAAIATCMKSMVGIEKNPTDTIDKLSHLEPCATGPVKAQKNHVFTGEHLVNQLIETSVNPPEEVDSDIALGQFVDDVLANETSDVSAEEIAIKEQSSASEVSDLVSAGDEGFGASLLNEFIDGNHKNEFGFMTKVSPATSIHGTEFHSSKKLERVCDNDYVSDVSSTLSSSEMDFSHVSCEKKIEETGVDFSRSSLSTESYCMFENTPENFTAQAAYYNYPVRVTEHVSESSDVLPIVSHEDKVAKMIHSSSVLSLDLIGAPDDFSDNDDESSLETIELCDKVKLEDSCAILDDSVLYAVSRRTQKLRSFKKKIQDAFASKKRLAKEYEQLAIWFGDVDIWPGQDTLQNLLPSTATIPLESENSRTHHICDSEWELL